MDLKDLVLKKVMYFVQSFVITAGDKSFEVPRTMIMNIDIVKDYDSMLYPLWYVCVNVPNWFYSIMTKNHDSISISMNLQYSLGKTSDIAMSPTNPMTTEVMGNFKAIIPQTSQIADPTIQNKLEKGDGAYNKGYTYGEQAFVELALYNTAAYNASFNKLNTILSSTTLTDAVTYCFNRCGITNILLSKSDNNVVYPEFKILPQNGISNIFRIVENYRFHDNGSTLFFDLTESYLITNKLGCHAWKNNEYKTTNIISISEYSEAMGNSSGICINNKEKSTTIAITKDSFSSQNIGSSPILKSTGETELVEIITKNATLEALTPNKEFILYIDSPNNTKYNGKYRLHSVSLNLTLSGEMMDPQFTITLRR